MKNLVFSSSLTVVPSSASIGKRLTIKQIVIPAGFSNKWQAPLNTLDLKRQLPTDVQRDMRSVLFHLTNS